MANGVKLAADGQPIGERRAENRERAPIFERRGLSVATIATRPDAPRQPKKKGRADRIGPFGANQRPGGIDSR